MRAISIIFRRELGAYLRSPIGWIIAAVLLLFDGIMFQAFAMKGENLSANVLQTFFMWTSITTGVAGVMLSCQLIATERSQQSMVLLNTSPIRDVEIVIGKYLAALVFLCAMVMLTFYMPVMIKVNGKITFAQVAVGYLGLFLFGSAAIAIGMFASALTRNVLLATILGAFFVGLLHVMWFLSDVLDPPLKETVGSAALWWEHFQQSFQTGVLNLRDVVYYGGVTYFFLLLAVKTLESKRWQ